MGVTDGSEGRIGKDGPTKGGNSSKGGQLPFLPSPESYSGRQSTVGTKPGQSSTTTPSTKIPWLPSKPE